MEKEKKTKVFRKKKENSNTKINLYIQAKGKIKVNQKAAYYRLLSSECSAMTMES